ncbi:DUF6541 family protein [Bifidobacterium aesculapii]|uniref:DUF6541 family protein n=1 Tax=Bifidobacterium aesculapii TaxID=1329411 RepID=UPI001364E348|nr:DUF6541 family protein [Bifidobacterium aesculapii]
MGSTSGGTAATSITKQDSDAAPGTAATPHRFHLRKPTAYGVLRVLFPLIGLACAFAIVLTWFPKPVFSTPIQSSDAPGHYYFISKLMHEGLGASFHLWPNDTFYPPLFHILAYLCSSLVGLLTGTPLSIYASFSVTWILASGLLFPLGMMLLCSYFLRSPFARAIRRRALAGNRSGDSPETGSHNSHNSSSRNSRNTLDTGSRNTPNPSNARNTPVDPSLNTPYSPHRSTVSKTLTPSHTPHPPSGLPHAPHESQSTTTQDPSLPEPSPHPTPDEPASALPWVRTALLTLAPILAVSSVCHPYTMLDAGPLVSYGFAMSLLPYLLTASLHLLDAINAMLLRRSTTHGDTPHDAPHNTPFNTPPTKQLTPQANHCGNSAPSPHGDTTTTANPGSPTATNPSNPNATTSPNANLANPNRPNAPSPTNPSANPSSHPSPSSPHILPPHTPSPHTPLQDTPHPLRAVLAWVAVTAACGAVMLLAHPRALFTYAMLMLPFIILRLPWRFVAAAFGAIMAGGAAFVVFMFATFKSERYADPASWFHSHMPSKTLADAILYGLSNGLDGAAGILFALLLLASAAAGIRFASAGLARRNIIALVVAFALVVIVYVSTVTLTGALPNMLSAPWYRDENRIVAMLPLTAVPLVVAGVGATLMAMLGRRSGNMRPAPVVGSGDSDASGRDVSPETGRVARVSATGTAATGAADVNADGRRHADAAVRVASAATVVLLLAATAAAQVTPRSRAATAARIAANTSLTAGVDPVEQLTEAKVAVLGRVVARTGTAATIVSDPMNGSMYATSMFGATMLYPIMNAQSTGDAWRLGATEEAFASGDGARLLETVCPIGADLPEYFLAMGDQATSLQSFPYKAQYDAFHNADLIGAYERGGVLVKVADYGSYGEGWALYRFGCGD